MAAKKRKAKKYWVGALAYFLFFASAKEQIGGSDGDDICGGKERWEQKVLVDPDTGKIHKTVEITTIEELLKINTKKKENKYEEEKPRMEIETHVYKIKNCFITDILREDDNDLHMVLEDGHKHTMIAEVPDPDCPAAKKSKWHSDFADVHDLIRNDLKNTYRHYMYSVTGVLFVDRSHGQTGKAANNVELHPVIHIKIEKQINLIANGN